jgi:hypothetical protein
VKHETSHPDEARDTGDHRSDEPRRYDSFVVRVWRHPGRSDFMRAEVRHVQSGTAEAAFDCTSDWIGDRIRERMAEEEIS